jgi:hypothetical protein
MPNKVSNTDWRDQKYGTKGKTKIARGMADGGAVDEKRESARDALGVRPNPLAPPTIQPIVAPYRAPVDLASGDTVRRLDTASGMVDGGIFRPQEGFRATDAALIAAGVPDMAGTVPTPQTATVVPPVQTSPVQTADPVAAAARIAQQRASDAALIAARTAPKPRRTVYGDVSAADYANGGRVDYTAGGKVTGPGTGTSDSVRAKIAGTPVNLSNTEYVLPADTTAAIGVRNLDRIKAATHTPVAARGVRGMNQGGVLVSQRDAEFDADVAAASTRANAPKPTDLGRAMYAAPRTAPATQKDVDYGHGRLALGQTQEIPAGFGISARQPAPVVADPVAPAPVVAEPATPAGLGARPLQAAPSSPTNYIKNDQTGAITDLGASQPQYEGISQGGYAGGSGRDTLGDTIVAGIRGKQAKTAAETDSVKGMLGVHRGQLDLAKQAATGTQEATRLGNVEKGFGADQMARVNALQNKISAMPPGTERDDAMQTLRDLSGKDRYIQGRNVRTYNDLGQVISEAPTIIQTATGQTIDQGAPTRASAPSALPKDKAQMVVGTTYQTARGLAQWDGKQLTTAQ